MRRSLLVSAILIGLWTHAAHAQCPAAIPAPADSTAVACFTVNKPVAQRCATAVSPADCDAFNAMAWNAGLLTPDGLSYLNDILFCAIVVSIPPGAPPRIYDFCPRGCFAADTQLLSSFKSAGGAADYVQASSVAPKSTLLSLTDDASLSDIILAPQSVKRVVLGPEDADLFVFALENGRTLRVTQHHPMVLDNGKIVEASQVGPGMSFVGIDGQSVTVTAITREKPTADVFNFETAGDTKLSHIIVAEGVLVGDLKIQNELASEQASIDLRR
jgi:hypothetical protein